MHCAGCAYVGGAGRLRPYRFRCRRQTGAPSEAVSERYTARDTHYDHGTGARRAATGPSPAAMRPATRAGRARPRPASGTVDSENPDDISAAAPVPAGAAPCGGPGPAEKEAATPGSRTRCALGPSGPSVQFARKITKHDVGWKRAGCHEQPQEFEGCGSPAPWEDK